MWISSRSANRQVLTDSPTSLSPMFFSPTPNSPMSLALRCARMSRQARGEPVVTLGRRWWLLRCSWGRVLAMFISVVEIWFTQSLNITLVATLFDHSGFILFIGFVLALFYYQYYGKSRMERFCNSWHVRDILVMVLRLNESLMLAESIESLHTRLLRPSTNFCPFLLCILQTLCVVDNTREDPLPLPWILMPKQVHLRQLAT